MVQPATSNFTESALYAFNKITPVVSTAEKEKSEEENVQLTIVFVEKEEKKLTVDP